MNWLDYGKLSQRQHLHFTAKQAHSQDVEYAKYVNYLWEWVGGQLHTVFTSQPGTVKGAY